MGPAATVDLMHKIVASTPANRDQDHIPMVVVSDPRIEDRTRAILAQLDTPLPPMLKALTRLESAGAELCAIACNTAHKWFDALQRASSMEFIHIVDAVERGVSPDARLVLLATRGTILARIYQDRTANDDRWILPSERQQAIVDTAIGNVKAGRAAGPALAELVAALCDAGANKVVLACTELPLALQPSGVEHLCVDATDMLARECVRRALPILA